MTAKCGAIILAAGQSRRMGSNKLIADFIGKPLVRHVADAVLAAGLPPAMVVLGHAADDVRKAFGGQEIFVTAEDHAEGMARSLAAGIRAVPLQWQAAIICLGDMPLVSSTLLRRLADNASSSAILAPTFEGRRGHPVLWGRDYFTELGCLQGDTGARSLFERHADRLRLVPWIDDSILRDADTPDALAAMRGHQSIYPK